jgi:hypothetical protein
MKATILDGSEVVRSFIQSDLIVFYTPVTFGCYSSVLKKALETICAHRKAASPPKACRLVAIVNSGFPEVRQSDTALAICRKFANESGMNWAGALVLGGGEAINGSPLAEISHMARHAVKSLNLAANALAETRTIPEEAAALMARPVIPGWLYLFFGKLGWRKKAKTHGVHRQLDRRPYA